MGSVPAVTLPVKMNVRPTRAAGAEVKSAPLTGTQTVVVSTLLSLTVLSPCEVAVTVVVVNRRGTSTGDDFCSYNGITP